MNFTKPWLHHYPSEVAPTYDYPKHNLAQFLIDSAASYPDEDALYFYGKKISYTKLLNASYRFANALIGLGIKKGDRVAIMLPNCPQTVISYYGTLLIGAVVVQTNPLYKERELEHQMVDSGVMAIVALDVLTNLVRKVQPQTALKHIIVTSVKDYLPFPKNWLYPLKSKKNVPQPHITYDGDMVSFRKLLATATNAPVCERVDAENDLALLQYTGGTTGLSKGVMLTHYNLVVNTIQTSHWCYRQADEKATFLAALPFFHVFGMTVLMNQSILRGGLMILVPKFEIELILKTIHQLRPTIFPGAPTMYIAIINHPKLQKYDLSSIEVCVSGAAPLPLEVQQRFEELTGGRLIEGYGLTEASPVTNANPIWGLRKIGTIGTPFPDTLVLVVNPDTGEEMPVGEIGELIIQGPQVMKGYWNREEETQKTLRDGWLYTGDMAKMDEDGYFTIVDRKKDMIIASGYNIYPREIEEVLYEHPAIKEAVVVGIPDTYRGETVKAFLVFRDGIEVSEKELEQWCRERLSAYKVPRKYEFRDSLPKTLVGKVLRRTLLEEEQRRQSHSE